MKKPGVGQDKSLEGIIYMKWFVKSPIHIFIIIFYLFSLLLYTHCKNVIIIFYPEKLIKRI